MPPSATGWMHGPAVLYHDLMERAWAAFRLPGRVKGLGVWYYLRETGPCLMCRLGYGPASRGYIPQEVLERGRDETAIRAFARSTQEFWRRLICGRCEDTLSSVRCRIHLREDLRAGTAGDLAEHQAVVQRVEHHIGRNDQSFRWENRGSDTVEDRAGLVSAVGWCSGWGVWLNWLGATPSK